MAREMSFTKSGHDIASVDKMLMTCPKFVMIFISTLV